MIANGLSSAMRAMAEQLVTTADLLDRLGKMWDADNLPSVVPEMKKKATAIRKDIATKRRKVRKPHIRKPHWTQTPEGKAKLAARVASRLAKKEGHEQADSPSTPSEGRS